MHFINLIFNFLPLAFTETATKELAHLETMLDKVEHLKIKLAEYFCEDKEKFLLEENCLKIFMTLCSKITETKEVRIFFSAIV